MTLDLAVKGMMCSYSMETKSLKSRQIFTYVTKVAEKMTFAWTDRIAVETVGPAQFTDESLA